MTISMPSTPGFKRSRFGLLTNTQSFTSPLTRATQRVLLGGARWEASYTLPRMTRAQVAEWQAFFLKLQGMANTFYGYDPDAKVARGALGGTPLVKGGSQTGNTLAIDGCSNNITGWGRAGDYFTCNSQMHMLTADCNTNGSGETTLTFQPPMRSSPADNAPVSFTLPTCTMILEDDAQAKWDTNENNIYEEKTFSAIEVFS